MTSWKVSESSSIVVGRRFVSNYAIREDKLLGKKKDEGNTDPLLQIVFLFDYGTSLKLVDHQGDVRIMVLEG